MAKCDIKKEG